MLPAGSEQAAFRIESWRLRPLRLSDRDDELWFYKSYMNTTYE